MIKIKTLADKYVHMLLLASVLFHWQCQSDGKEKSNNQSPRIRKEVTLISPKLNTTIKLGESLTFSVSHQSNIVIDSVRLSVGNKSYDSKGSELTISSAEWRVGIPNLRLITWYDGKEETLYPKVTILPTKVPVSMTYQQVNTLPHDPSAYTQGLFVLNGHFIESTGQRGSSTLRKVKISDGRVIKQVSLDSEHFGEGATLWKDRIYQLTWTSQQVFVYDLNFSLLTTFTYGTEGWGITTMGDTLIMSDGSEKLYLRDPQDFREIDVIQVYDHKGKVDNLNELEYFDGAIYANVYGKDEIVKIDPVTGAVIAVINLKGIIDRSKLRGMDYVLNGIAFDEKNDKIYVTGKWWPSIFEVKFIPVNTLN